MTRLIKDKNAILKKAVTSENNSLYIQQLCIITGMPPKQVKASVENVKRIVKERAANENKTEEEIIKELTNERNKS